MPGPFYATNPARPLADHPIVILSNPIHTDIAVPVDDRLRGLFGFLADAGLDVEGEGVRYVIFGWGGRAFYTQTPTWADLKAVPLFKGLTLDSSVMHVELAGDIPVNEPDTMAIKIDDRSFEALLNAIRRSFAVDAGKPVAIGYAYGAYDAFFEAKGSFNALAGCNTWTAAQLRQAGISTGWWTPLPWMLRMALRLHNPPEIVAR